MNILIVEDEQINVKMLKFYIMNYFHENELTYKRIDVAENGLEAIGYCTLHNYDVMFLDVKMPKCDGIKVLNVFKEKNYFHKPHICMVTALGEDKYKNLFKLLNANSYIIKPFERDRIIDIIELVQKQLEKPTPQQLPNNQAEQAIDEDPFFDDDFFDFDDEDESVPAQTTSYIQQTKTSAQEFLADYENLEYILEDVEEIDTVLFDLITSLDVATIDQQKEDLRFALGKYTTFLNSLMSFGDLSNSLRTLADQVESIDIEEYEDLQATFIVELLRAILQDLSQWKEFVFIHQTAQDVYYINASVISNCEQLQRAMNNK